MNEGRDGKYVVARAARAARAARVDKSAGANFGNLSVLGDTDGPTTIDINRWIDGCWCSSVLVFLGDEGKNSTLNITSNSAETSTKNHIFHGGFGTIG